MEMLRPFLNWRERDCELSDGSWLWTGISSFEPQNQGQSLSFCCRVSGRLARICPTGSVNQPA
ncbi:MAG: hypothetical protein O9353_11040, partial [Bacteroidia bacterium]|nr:hypothetical protein [Bacteroidia bacterium]